MAARQSGRGGGTGTTGEPASDSGAHSNASDVLREPAQLMMLPLSSREHSTLQLRYFALGMATTMQQYEAEIAPLKRRLFADAVTPDTDVLELGMGTGPNLRYYGSKVTPAS